MTHAAHHTSEASAEVTLAPRPWQRRGMTDTLHRHWMMLQSLPRLPQKISTTRLRDRLIDEGHDIDMRSVQRDLVKLSNWFSIVSDGKKPAGWSWTKTAPVFDVPSMGAHVAITFRLVEEHLGQQLPPATLRVLAPHFKVARGVLRGLRKEGLPSWADKVRVVPRGQAQLPPAVDGKVLAAVYDGLLEERVLDVRYSARGGKVTEATVHPLGLVFRDSVPYLIGTFWDYDDVRQLALQRVQKAAVLDEKRRAPRGFSLDEYVNTGALSFLVGQRPLALVARFRNDAAMSVLETPLCEGQKVVDEGDGWVRVEASVADTLILRGWLMSFGAKVEVLKPKRLRDALKAEVKELAALYR
jgi:hypothetical protein